jgi:hypothetical protein
MPDDMSGISGGGNDYSGSGGTSWDAYAGSTEDISDTAMLQYSPSSADNVTGARFKLDLLQDFELPADYANVLQQYDPEAEDYAIGSYQLDKKNRNLEVGNALYDLLDKGNQRWSAAGFEGQGKQDLDNQIKQMFDLYDIETEKDKIGLRAEVHNLREDYTKNLFNQVANIRYMVEEFEFRPPWHELDWEDWKDRTEEDILGYVEQFLSDEEYEKFVEFAENSKDVYENYYPKFFRDGADKFMNNVFDFSKGLEEGYWEAADFWMLPGGTGQTDEEIIEGVVENLTTGDDAPDNIIEAIFTFFFPNWSDVALKENIVKLGNLPDGLPIYEFNYHWDSKRHVGLMAQDVEKIYPDAVTTDKDGYKMVNYKLIKERNKR